MRRHLLSSIAIALLFLSLAMTSTHLSWYVNAQELEGEPTEIPFEPLPENQTATNATEPGEATAPATNATEPGEATAPATDGTSLAAPGGGGTTEITAETPCENPDEVRDPESLECGEPQDGQDGAGGGGTTEITAETPCEDPDEVRDPESLECGEPQDGQDGAGGGG